MELAQLKYLLPRLSGTGASMSRLGGGISTRGPGARPSWRWIAAASAAASMSWSREIQTLDRQRSAQKGRRERSGFPPWP